MSVLGIIGGSGLNQLEGLTVERTEQVITPYGSPSSPLFHGRFNDRPVIFLPRHGEGHVVPPHRINYRANIWALREAGVEQLVAVAAVGGITARLGPGVICIPDQIIDYTWGREQSFFDGKDGQVSHVDFTEPYCEALRKSLLQAAKHIQLEVQATGCYAATQGPRLESVAEISRLERDGCDLVGMTGMPEAGLARELDLCYACCALSVNWAAGKTDGPITMAEIDHNLSQGMHRIHALLAALAP